MNTFICHLSNYTYVEDKSIRVPSINNFRFTSKIQRAVCRGFYSLVTGVTVLKMLKVPFFILYWLFLR